MDPLNSPGKRLVSFDSKNGIANLAAHISVCLDIRSVHLSTSFFVNVCNRLMSRYQLIVAKAAEVHFKCFG